MSYFVVNSFRIADFGPALYYYVFCFFVFSDDPQACRTFVLLPWIFQILPRGNQGPSHSPIYVTAVEGENRAGFGSLAGFAFLGTEDAISIFH